MTEPVRRMGDDAREPAGSTPCAFCDAPGADDVHREDGYPDVACCSDDDACEAQVRLADDGTLELEALQRDERAGSYGPADPLFAAPQTMRGQTALDT